jgi:hypothetical protein
MYIQWSVKGIAGTVVAGSANALTKSEAFDLVKLGKGITSNWWRHKRHIFPHEAITVLNEQNLDRHLHDYDNFGKHSPFISVASGCIERDALLQRNIVYSAVDRALWFATGAWARPGALFYCWLQVGLNPAAEVFGVAEAVRELNVYHRWSPYQLEGEVTAKLQIPANQISRVEWWDGRIRTDQAVDTFPNPKFVDPASIANLRDLF